MTQGPNKQAVDKHYDLTKVEKGLNNNTLGPQCQKHSIGE